MDILGEPSKYKDTAEVLIAPEFYDMFVQALRYVNLKFQLKHEYFREQGIDEVKVIKKDIGNEIRRERKEMQRSKARSRRALHNAMNFDDKNYHSYQDVRNLLFLALTK